MADAYDRDGQEGGDGGSFVMGLLTGTVLGAGLGMLFAPKAGSELRGQLSEQAGTVANTASEGYRKASEAASEGYKKASEVASEWAGKGRDAGREVYDRTKNAVNRGAEEAQRYVREATGATTGSPTPSTAGGPSALSFGPENIRSTAHDEILGGELGGSHTGPGSTGSTGPSGSRRS
jgi:gas vesicle protein